MSVSLSARSNSTLVQVAAAAAAFFIGFSLPDLARAGDHYISLSKIFPVGKCSPVIANFEIMVSEFAGGELTEHKIRNDEGKVIEVITIFINQKRDQWAMVGSRHDDNVIFCLYASGNGEGSVKRRALKPGGSH